MKGEWKMAVFLTVVAGIGLAAGAQSAESVWRGVYSAAQAQRGQALYGQHCAPCHGSALEGNGQSERAERLARAVPPLSGDLFKGKWNGRPLSDLFDKIQKTMPRDEQGAINPGQTADILAWMLKFNQFPEGKEDLPSDAGALTEVIFETVRRR